MKLSLRSPKRLILLLLIGPFLSFTLSAQIIVANNNTSGAGSFAAALDNITAGQTITIPAGVTGVISVGALNVGTSCNIVSHANVVLDGGGAYKHGRPWLQNLLTIATSNVTITDLILTGATGTNAFDGSGILIADGQSNITFNNLDVSGSKNSGIASSAWVCLTCGNSLGTSDITINGCNVTNNGASGVVLSHSDNVIITGGTYDSNSQHGVYLNGDTYVAGVYVPTTDLANAVGVTNSSVTGVTSTNNGNGGLTIAGNSTGNVIDNCITNDNNEHGLWLRLASSNNTIQNCTSNNNGGGSLACGINVSLGGNLNNNILNNSCSGNQDYGIYLYDNYGIPNDNNLISGNTITTSGSHGIYVLNSTNTLVRSNTIHDNGTGINGGDGINFGNSSSGGEISANTLYSNIGDGVNITDGVLIPADGSDSNTVPILPGGSNNNDIFGNYVGILPDGTIGGNTLNGIKIDKSSGNQVGVNGRNFISGNDNHGIYLDEIPVGTQSIIRDNYIGTNLTGTAAEGNALSGIFLSNCKTVLIDDNLISGNLQDGIQLGNAATNISTDVVEIENNLIGTDVNGTLALPNSRYGINVDNATFVEIGDGTASGRNLVSANGQDGIYISNDAAFIDIDENYIGLDITGLADLGNGGNGVTMTGANNNKILNNYISGNTSNGIYVQSAATASNTIQSNFIGLLIDGSNGGNGADGINLDACKSNTIGGTLGNGNVIGWNTGDGISLNGNGTDDNIIGDNLIGIDGSDNLIPNGGNGIYIASTATSNEIGVNASGTSAGNIISGNTENGIIIDGSNNNKIDGNIIGMNSTKLAVLPNGGAFSGIHITGSGATLNVIGGVARNYIAGAHLQQILIDNGANINTVKNVDLGDAILGALAQSTGNAVLITGAGTDGNIIGGVLGTDGNNIFHSNNVAVLINNQASGNTVKSNVFEGVGASSPVSAIQVTDGHSNIIGGADATQGNVIKETSANAIVVDGTSDGNQVQFNYIGVDENELSQGPIKGHGILLSGAGVSNTIVNENVIGNLDDATKSAIYIDGVAAISTLYGNYVGITRNDLAVANAGNGVSVLNASDAVSVGTAGQNPNVISNNVGHGVEITDSDLSVIINNHIGTEVDGNAPAGNSGNGIHVGTGNTSINIEGNVIASNQLDGILIDATVAGTNTILNNKIGLGQDNTTALKNGLAGTAGQMNGINLLNSDTQFTIDGNAITSHDENQVRIDGSDNHVLSNNTLGTNSAGATNLGGILDVVLITNGSGTLQLNDNTIVGSTDGNGVHIDNTATNDNVLLSGNRINGNAVNGVLVNGTNTDITISGNGIGVEVGNLTVNGNGANGVLFTTFTGDALLENNVIGGNVNGIELDDADDVTIDGNFIGLSTQNSSDNDLRNTGDGVYVHSGSTGNSINGNSIGFNDDNGVEFNNSSTNTVSNNRIGIEGVNNTGNGSNAISLAVGSNSNTISGNTIGNHTIGSGVLLDASSLNAIAGNIIGTDAAASTTDLGNQYGVKIQNASSGNQINGSNTIAFSTTMGIDISGATSLLNTITTNSLYCNGGGNTTVAPGAHSGLGTGIQLAGDGANGDAGKVISVAYTDANGDPKTATTFSAYPATQDGAANTLTMANLTFASGWTVDVYSNDINCQNCQGYAMETGLSGSVLSGAGALTLTDASIDGSKTYVLILTDPTGNSTEHSACSIAPTCAYPWANFITGTPEYSLTAATNPEDKASFCQGGTHQFELDPSQDLLNLDAHEYRWYSIDSTNYDFTSHDTTLTGVPTNASFTEVKAAGSAPDDLLYDANATGYYIFYINVQGDQACGVMSEVVKIQAHIDPIPTIVGADKVCEETIDESYQSLSTDPFLQHALDFNLITVATYTVTGATLKTAATGIAANDYTGAAASYGTQTLDFTTTDATLSLVESYGIKSSSLLAATDLTCSNATPETFEITLQSFPLVTNTTVTESICDVTASSGFTLTSDVTSATFKWSSLATNVTGNTAGPTTGNLPAETLTLTDGALVGNVVYSPYGTIDITPSGLTARTCEDATLTTDFTVTVQPLPTTPIPRQDQVCVGATLNLFTYDPTVPSVGPSTFAWSGPLSFTSTSEDPTRSNATTAMDGTYTVEVTSTYTGITGGCKASETVVVTVDPNPTPAILGEQAPCPNSSENYTLSGATIPASGVDTYTWTNTISPAVTVTGAATATYAVTYQATGTGNVELEIEDNNGCIGSTARLVTVLSNPSVVVTDNAPVCDDKSITFSSSATPSSAAYTYEWFTGTPGFGTQIGGQTGSTYTTNSDINGGVHSDGTKIYVQIVPVNCPLATAVASDPDVDGTAVDFNTTPTAVTITGLSVVCEGDPITLTGAHTGTLEGTAVYSWTTPVGGTSSANPSFTDSPASAGTYSLTITNSSGGCNASTTKEVSTIVVDVTASASDTDIDDGSSVTISAAPTDYSAYTWVTSDGDNKGANVSFVDTPTQTTTYIVTATEGTCSASSEVTVNVRALVVVPSMFTPGNGDGLNDYWILTNIEDYPEAEIRVYNRWGNVVYKGAGGPEYLGNPWDGTRNGTDLPSAVYYYVIELNYNNIIMNGSVTIMR